MGMKAVATELASNRRAIITAACVASLLMFAHALVHRALAETLAASATASPFDPNILKAFPMEIAGWEGEETPIEEAILRRTDAPGHISRRYARKNGLEIVSFYLACGVEARDLMPHRPEVCYVGNGWTLTKRLTKALSLDGGATLPCSLTEFSRGLLNTERLVVLHYYIVDGQCCQDVSLLRSKAWHGSGVIRHVVQVQIVTSVVEMTGADFARRTVCDFALASAPAVAGLFKTPLQPSDRGIPLKRTE
jgi:EpsI family protein